MDKAEFTNSTQWQIVEKALREYGTELVKDMRICLEKNDPNQAMRLAGALNAVDEMLALPNKLWLAPAPLSKDNKVESPPANGPIKRFH